MFSRAENSGTRKRLALTLFALATVLTWFARLRTPMAKGGRPRKEPLRLRAIRVTVRFSPAEHQQLRLLAALHQMPACSYLRDDALSRPLPVPRPSINEAAYRELCRIGSNLNQLTRLANSGQAVPGVLSTLKHLTENLESIKAVLRPSRPRRS